MTLQDSDIRILKVSLRSVYKIFPFNIACFVSYFITVTILLTVLLFVSDGIERVEAQLTNTSSLTESIVKGDSLFNQGKYEEAITYFDKVLALDPNDRDMLYYKGISLEGLGKHEEAITYFDKVLALDQNDTDTLTYKGISLESLGRHEEALAYFDKVLALDPNNENTLSWKEHTLRKIGKYDNTVTNVPEQADFTDTNNTEFNDAKNKAKDLLTNIFNTLFSETGEKFSNSKYGVDMAFPKNWTGIEMKVVPMALVSPEGFNFTEMFSTISNATVDTVIESIVSDGVNELSEQKKQELAESVSNKLTQKFENMTSTMGILIHDKEFARLVNSFNPNSTIPEDSLTSIFERLMLASDPTTVCDRKTLERITINDNISAEKSTQQCLLTDSNLKRDNLNYFILTPNAVVGIIFSSDPNNENEKYLREFEESLKSLSVEKSLPVNNKSIQEFLNYDMKNNNDTLLNDTAQNILSAFNGDELLSQGKYEEAINLYDARLSIDPKDVDALHNKGVALHYLGKYEEAINSYDKVLALDPKYVNALYGKGAALANLGREEEAISWYDKALAADPKNVEALNGKGLALGKLGRMEEAIIWSDKALEVDPKNLDALNDKGGALGALGRYEESIGVFDKALEVDPKNVRALSFKGLSLYNLGKKAEALTWIDKALAIDPTNQMVLNVKSQVQG